MAITALILALVGLFVPVVLPLAALVLALLAGSRIRRSGGALKGRGLATGAAITAGVVLVMQSAAVALIVNAWPELSERFRNEVEAEPAPSAAGPSAAGQGAPGTREIRWHELTLGSCFTPVRDPIVQRASCDQPHLGEVFGVFEISGTEPPSPEDMVDVATGICTGHLQAVPNRSRDGQPLAWSFIGPNEQSWAEGIRVIVCYVRAQGEGQRLTGSVLPG